MARTFGTYSPVVPLGTTWEESLVLEDADGTPINITGYSVRAQLHEKLPVRAGGGAPNPEPLFELTTPGFYGAPPAWPVIEAFTVPLGTDGAINLRVDDTWVASPANAKRKLQWDIRLVNKATGYVIPVVSGAVSFLPARTV